MRRLISDMALKGYCTAESLYRKYWMDRLGDQRGAATVEYALLIAVIVTMVIAAATYMFDPLKDFFLSVVEKIQGIADDSTAESNF